MANERLTNADLSAVDFNGLVNEDVMQTIWDISHIPLPLNDMIGTEDSDNANKEWTTDALRKPNTGNATVEGEDASGNDTNTGERIGNRHQIPDMVVKVSDRSRNVDTIGRSDELAYQIMMRQRELRRDCEAIKLTEQVSRADDGIAIPGLSAGLFAFIRDGGQATPGNALIGATGARPGFATGLVGAVTPGTTRPLSETLVRDAVELAYLDGGDPSYLMTVPSLIRKFSEYLFTSSARIASLYSEVGQSESASTAKGSVNMFVTDFGTVELTPNRLMQAEDIGGGTERTNVAVIDPNYLAVSYLQGFQVELLARTGTADNRQMTVDFTLVVNSLDAHATICDIDYTADVVQ